MVVSIFFMMGVGPAGSGSVLVGFCFGLNDSFPYSSLFESDSSMFRVFQKLSSGYTDFTNDPRWFLLFLYEVISTLKCLAPHWTGNFFG